MAFNFDKHKRKLELDDWSFSKNTSVNHTEWTAKREKFLTKKYKFFSVFDIKPEDKDLKNFVEKVKKMENEYGIDEALIIAPECDRFALSKFIEKTGIFAKKRLKKIISFRKCEAKLKIPKEVREKIIEEEIKKPSNIKKIVKKGEDYTIFKKICRLAKNFEIGPSERKNERLLETLFKGFLKGTLSKEIIDYQSNSGAGRYDILIPNRKIGIELKVLKRKADLYSLEGQIRKYMHDLEYLCVLIVNQKGYDATQLKDTINYIKTFGNVEVIVR